MKLATRVWGLKYIWNEIIEPFRFHTRKPQKIGPNTRHFNVPVQVAKVCVIHVAPCPGGGREGSPTRGGGRLCPH